MQSSNPTDHASSASSSLAVFNSAGTPLANNSRNEQAATGQDGTTWQPRLHASNRSGTSLVSDGDARLPDDYAQAIGVLNDQLQSLRATNPLDLKQALQFFDAAKALEQKLKAILRDDPQNLALRKLADGLYVFLPRLSVLLRGDDSARLDIETIHTLCLGLSTCVAPAPGAMFDKKRQQNLKPPLQEMTNALMERASKAGLPTAAASIGVVLDILNWVSRALKADCIEASPAITAAFNDALTVFEEWLAGTPSSCRLTAHQLGKCAVQINTILRYKLFTLDVGTAAKAGRHRLAVCGARLCYAGVAARLLKDDGVACTNVCNLVKDMMEHGLLSANDEQLWPSLTGLTQLISQIPATRMVEGDCRILANCANFLRVLDERAAGISGQALPPKLAPHWEAASRAVLNVVNEPAFMTLLASGQTVANLISFVKRCDRRLQSRSAAGFTTTSTTTTTTTAPAAASAAQEPAQELLRAAASRLIQHAFACGPDAFTAPETLSGLLSGLAYIVRRNLVPATPELTIFMAGLMDNMAWRSSKWKEKSRMVALPALRGLMTAKLVTLKQAQPGLDALLGPCDNPSGYSMEDLATAIRDKGAIEDEVLALPPAEAVALVLTSPSRKALRPALPPGYTRIIPPSIAGSGHGDMGRKASSFQAAMPSRTTTLAAANKPENQPWQSPRKVARANRQAAVSHARAAPLPQAQQPALSAAAAGPPQRKAETEPQPKPASATRRKPATQAKPPQKRNQQTTRTPNASAKPEDEWFELLNSRDPEAPGRLKQLAGQFDLLNRKKEKGRESRSALACALASGQLTVVAWLLTPETGYRFDEQIGPFLSAVEQNIELLDDEVVASLDYFLAMQEDAARMELQRHFATHQPTSVGMQNLLKRHGLTGAGLEAKAGDHPRPQGPKGQGASPAQVSSTGLATAAPVTASMPTFRTTTTGISTATTTTTTAGDRQTFDPEDAQAQVKLGDCYWSGTGVKEDKAQAFAWYRAAADQGLAEAQLRLGNCYWHGTGVSVDKAQAFEWYSAAACQGLAEAQSGVGYCYQKGIGVKEHKARAAGWYRTAARNGDAGAQYNLGMCYELGIGVSVDMAAAVESYRKAAYRGLAQAQFALGNCYENGTGVKEDMTEAFVWCSKAAYQGLAEAQLNLGMCYAHGTGVTRDDARAVEWYEKAANHGLAGAQLNLGSCYGHGTGVTRDYARAVAWYEKAANQGLAGAQLNLGMCYAHGIGVNRDYARAAGWYEKAANQGLDEAQFTLGSFWWNGTGVKEDKAQGFAWYRKAADQGHAKAQLNLGRFLLEGINVKMDQDQALAWYRKAASQGLAEAQFSLGHCYLRGTGVKQDLNEAARWFRQAANQGYTRANEFLN